jgi:hypothetical protein
MPRIKLSEILGPSNTLRSVNADADRTVNWMEEGTAPGPSAKNPAWLTPTPGLKPWVVLDNAPLRALFSQDGRGFAVAGSNYYEVFASQTFTALGNVATDSFQATICSNGSAGDQNFIVSGGNGYIHTLSTNAFAQIADPDFPANAAMGEFMDGYFFVSIANSRQFQISALEDGTSWDPLDFAQRSDASDNIQTLIRMGRLILLIGTKTSEPWYDSGDPLFPFAPIQGSFIDRGGAARFGACRTQDTLAWLLQDENGAAQVVLLQGLHAAPISNPAVARGIANAGQAPNNDLSNAVLFSYEQDDHMFVVVQMPTAETTWVYDFTTQHWHERGLFNEGTGLFVPNHAICHMYFAGKHLMGDKYSGAIYECSPNFFDETMIS